MSCFSCCLDSSPIREPLRSAVDSDKFQYSSASKVDDAAQEALEKHAASVVKVELSPAPVRKKMESPKVEKIPNLEAEEGSAQRVIPDEGSLTEPEKVVPVEKREGKPPFQLTRAPRPRGKSVLVTHWIFMPRDGGKPRVEQYYVPR